MCKCRKLKSLFAADRKSFLEENAGYVKKWLSWDLYLRNDSRV
jgi:hypothetical protein